jgi:hypothetical protein
MKQAELKINQAERKMLGYIAGWNKRGTPLQIATAYPYEIDATHKRLATYLTAVATLAQKGLVRECAGFYHSKQSTCDKCE